MSRDFRRIARFHLEFRHLHRNGGHTDEERIATDFASAVSDHLAEFCRVAHSDLFHLNARLKFRRQGTNEFAEIDASLRDVVDDETLAPKNTLDFDERKRDVKTMNRF